MKQCKKCGSTMAADTRFCGVCGQSVMDGSKQVHHAAGSDGDSLKKRNDIVVAVAGGLAYILVIAFASMYFWQNLDDLDIFKELFGGNGGNGFDDFPPTDTPEWFIITDTPDWDFLTVTPEVFIPTDTPELFEFGESYLDFVWLEHNIELGGRIYLVAHVDFQADSADSEAMSLWATVYLNDDTPVYNVSTSDYVAADGRLANWEYFFPQSGAIEYYDDIQLAIPNDLLPFDEGLYVIVELWDDSSYESLDIWQTELFDKS